MKQKELNDRQKAAILYHCFTGCKDREILFYIAEGENRYNKLKDSAKRQTFHNWYNSELIQDGIREFTYQIERKKKEFEQVVLSRLKTETTNSSGEPVPSESVNFLDRDEFLKFLNDRANQITDDKLRNDILKMLSDNLRYKDSETAENSEIQRFYTPVLCENCPIYNKCKDCKLEPCPKML